MSFQSFLIGYGAFTLGSLIYLLMKVNSFKRQAKSNPNPNFVFSAKDFFSDEWINIAVLWLGGIALVLFLPTLTGGTVVDIVNSKGVTMTSLPLKTALAPMEFMIGLGGNSTLFSLFGKYQKTFLNQLGVEQDKKDDN